jgi:hypothetical protein
MYDKLSDQSNICDYAAQTARRSIYSFPNKMYNINPLYKYFLCYSQILTWIANICAKHNIIVHVNNKNHMHWQVTFWSFVWSEGYFLPTFTNGVPHSLKNGSMTSSTLLENSNRRTGLSSCTHRNWHSSFEVRVNVEISTRCDRYLENCIF